MKKFIYLYKNKNNKKFVFDKPGNYTVFLNNSQGKYDFFINEENVNLNIFGIYLGKNNLKYKVETNQIHKKPNSKSNLLFKGVFNDKSAFNFRGLIRIEKTAMKSIAYQKNQNLNLSDDPVIKTQPNLEILSNDVICTHAITTSYLNKKNLYYLNTRSIKKNEAKKLLIKGFLNEVINKIGNVLDHDSYKKIKTQINKFLL